MAISAAKLTQLVVELGTAMETIDDQHETIQDLQAALDEANTRSARFELLLQKRAEECAALQLQVADHQLTISRLQNSCAEVQEKYSLLEKQLIEQKREADQIAERAEKIYNRRSNSLASSPAIRPVDMSIMTSTSHRTATSMEGNPTASQQHQPSQGSHVGMSLPPSGATLAHPTPAANQGYPSAPPHQPTNQQTYYYEHSTAYNQRVATTSRTTSNEQERRSVAGGGSEDIRLQVAELQKLYSNKKQTATVVAPSTVYTSNTTSEFDI